MMYFPRSRGSLFSWTVLCVLLSPLKKLQKVQIRRYCRVALRHSFAELGRVACGLRRGLHEIGAQLAPVCFSAFCFRFSVLWVCPRARTGRGLRKPSLEPCPTLWEWVEDA